MKLAAGIDGIQMNETVVESLAKPVLDLNEKIHVLHVDDDLGFLKLTKQCVEMEAYIQVDMATSVDEALNKLEEKKYDVIVSDYQMPVKDGLEFLKELKERGNTTPFIMFTGKGREQVAIRALNLGANQYLDKVGESETVYLELTHSITELAKIRKAEEKQCESEEKFRTLFEKANDGLVFVDLSGRIVDINQKAAEIAERRKEELVGRSFLDLGLVSSEGQAVLVGKLRQQEAGKSAERFESEIEKENGEKRLIEISSASIQNNNIPIGSLAIVRDITERKKSEQDLFDKRMRLQNIFDVSPNAILVIDLNGKIVDCNEQAQKMLGYSSRRESVGRDSLEFIAEKDRKRAIENMEKTLKQGVMRNIEYTIIPRDGGERILSVTASVLNEVSGNPTGFVSVIEDVTERKKAEEALRESEERYSRLSAATFEGIGISERGKIIDVNDQLAKMLGYEPSEMTGKSVIDMVAPTSRDLVKTNMVKENEGPYEHLAIKKDGSIFPVEIRARSIHYKGHIARVSAIRDIADRQKLDESSRENAQELQKAVSLLNATLESTADGVLVVDTNGKIRAFNKKLVEMWKIPKDVILSNAEPDHVSLQRVDGRALDFLMEHLKRPNQFMKRARELYLTPELETHGTLEFRDGRILEFYSKPQRVEGEVVGGVWSFRNITERKKAEKALRISEERYKNLSEELQRFSTAVKASVDGIAISDMQGRIVELNDAALRLYGANEKKELIGKDSLELVASEEREELVQNMKEAAANGFAGAKEIDAITLKGQRVPVEVTTTLMKDSEGHAVGFLGIIRDLAERKDQHRLLEESQQKFAGLFSANPEATVYVDPNMHILEVNPRFESLFGYPLDEIRGKHIDDVVVPENLLEEGKMLNEKAAAGCIYHDTLRRRKDGSLIPVSVSAAPIYVGKGLIGYVWLYKDISQQKIAEESLRESEERFKALFAGGPEASVYLTPDFIIQNINRRFEQLFGHSLAEIKGKHLDDVVVQKDKKDEAAMLNERAVGGYVYHDTVRRQKNGSLVPVSISAAPIVIKGQLSGFVGTYKDISDLKRAEEKLALMNEKLRVVGGLTRHDIRNKLSIVTGNAYLMKKKLEDRPDVIEGLGDLESACAAIVQLLEFARDYERLGLEELTYINVEDSIENAVSQFKNIGNIKIVNECHGLNVLADSLLSRLFYNLIDNSLKHGDHVTQIRVSCEQCSDRLSLIYEDDGVGISQEARPRIFTEGYTTGKGSGYGLYLIKKMMEAFGWSIEETGLPGRGAHFTINIPRLNKQGKENYQCARDNA